MPSCTHNYDWKIRMFASLKATMSLKAMTNSHLVFVLYLSEHD